MAEGGDLVLEGFICPICKADLRTAVNLLSHFDKDHNEDKDVLQSFKELFGKAKKKILKSDYSNVGNSPENQSSQKKVSGYHPEMFGPQDVGSSRSLTKAFNSMRSQHLEHYTVETNKLLIRLDKIIRNMPSDPLKRKAHEQEAVPWVDEKMVKLCPSCSKSFHLTRRKHHCRLCGFVMCSHCSFSLDLDVARKMIAPLCEASVEAPALLSTIHKMKRSNSSSSLNSVLSLVEGVHQADQGLRVCSVCLKLLENREALRESRTVRPIIIQFYERLRGYMDDALHLLPTYIMMYNSLCCGESSYQHKDAQILWVKLLHLAENIDSLSKKISQLGTADTENPPRGRTLLLQQQIRVATTAWLRNHLLGLPTLPTEAKYLEMQEQRRKEMTARIHQEQLAAQASMSAQLRARDKGTDRSQFVPSNDIPLNKQSTVLAATGWTPEKAKLTSSDDIIVQQINNIKHYIKEARIAQREDEVVTLEKNLQMLQEEYWRQQELAEQ